MRLQVIPQRSLVDELLRIEVSGLRPGQRVRLAAQQVDDEHRTWRAEAEFQADADGRVDVASQAPLAGSYAGVESMGLIWSMALAPDEARQGVPFIRRQPTPIDVEFSANAADAAETDGARASQHVERLLVADGVERIVVREDGLVGTLFVPPGPGPHPVIVTLSGSGGGLSEPAAALYASHGYAGLALAYFNMESLPPDLIEIPLEYFETAFGWIQRQQRLDGERIGVSGTSRGGELVLLLGSMFPAIKAVVAYVPSGIVFGGIARSGVRGMQAAWTYAGREIPYLQPDPTKLSPLPPPPAEGEAVRLTPYFERNMEDAEAVARVEIPVERINGPLLLISGKDDAMWPSTRLAEIARRRLEEHHFPHPYKHLEYAGAGHMIGTPHNPCTVVASVHQLTGGLNAFGGSPRGYAMARQGSWHEILSMLERAFAPTPVGATRP
jgi:dienelactone hydrolase